MDFHLRKIELAKSILNIQDEDKLSELEALLDINSSKTKIIPMDLKELNRRIDKSENDFENGNYTDSESLLKKYS